MTKTAQTAQDALAALVAENAEMNRRWSVLSQYVEDTDDANLYTLMRDIECGEM